MFENKSVAVVVPAFNEALQIEKVIKSMPDFVDRIVVVNDGSTDATSEIIRKLIFQENNSSSLFLKNILNEEISDDYNRAGKILQDINREEAGKFVSSKILNKNDESERVILIEHDKNHGVGAAIASGYKWCKDHNIYCTAVMAGDGQMDPDELESICLPVIHDNIDYVKGNRLIHASSWVVIPRIRYFGNSILSVLTKIASGYWHVSDTQTGFTAISNKALNAIPLYKIFKRYGMPNDMLVKLNIAFCTLKEVEIKPVYYIGERSKMHIGKIILPVSWLLFRSFFKRLWQKYLFRDFHPLFLLYHISFVLGLVSLPYGIKILFLVLAGKDANPVTVLAFIFLFISGLQSLLFAMWMDIQDNERLYKT